MKKLFLLSFIILFGCSNDVPEPEVKNMENKEEVDPIQIEYELHDPAV